MSTLPVTADERIVDVGFTKDSLRVELKDGRSITVPLKWYPRLLNASPEQRKKWQLSSGGYGIHWPEIDEDLSSEGLLRGAPAPAATSKSEPSSENKHDLLLKAIHDRKLINFEYQGKARVAEPHDYGIQNGVERLLCYQVGGASGSGRLPSWRLVEVAEIEKLKITNRNFPGNRPAPSGQHHHWDVLFDRVAESASAR
jgi:uncharacterized protein DUF2442